MESQLKVCEYGTAHIAGANHSAKKVKDCSETTVSSRFKHLYFFIAATVGAWKISGPERIVTVFDGAVGDARSGNNGPANFLLDGLTRQHWRSLSLRRADRKNLHGHGLGARGDAMR